MNKNTCKIFSALAALFTLTVAFAFEPPEESNATFMVNSDNIAVEPTWSEFVNANLKKLSFTGNGITNGDYDTSSPISIAIDKTYFDGLYMPLYPTQVKISSNNTTTGTNVIAVGTSNTVSGNNSIAVGQSNLASGPTSGAFGYDVDATFDSSFALGAFLTTNATSQFVVGRYSNPDASKMFIVANGVAGGRKNIFAVDTAGNTVITGDFTNSVGYKLQQTLQVNYSTKKAISDTDARNFKDNNTIGDYSGAYVFVDTYGGGAVPYTGTLREYINSPSIIDKWYFSIDQTSNLLNAKLTAVGNQTFNGSSTLSLSNSNVVLTPTITSNVNDNTFGFQNFRIQNTSYPITGTFSLTPTAGGTATEYTGTLAPTDGRVAADLISGKLTGALTGNVGGTTSNTINANSTFTYNIEIPATTTRSLLLKGNPSGNVPGAVKYVSEYFTDVVAKLISPDGEILWCVTTGNFNASPLVTLYPDAVDRNAKVFYYTNGTYVNSSGKTVESPKKAWDYVNGQLASNGTRYWTIGQYETLNGNTASPYYKIRITGIEIFPDLTNPDFLEAFSDPRNTLKIWRSHGVYGAEYVGIRNNDPTYQDTTAPIWKPAKLFYTKPAPQN